MSALVADHKAVVGAALGGDGGFSPRAHLLHEADQAVSNRDAPYPRHALRQSYRSITLHGARNVDP